jgi:hypothetical protein
MTGKLSVEIEAFKPMRSNTLIGFVTITIPEMHLRIVDCPVHEKGESRWVGLPAKAQITKDGVARRESHGKIAYSTVLEFTDPETRNAFSERVIAALLTRFPSVFGMAAA